ncbi:hypothetical protein Acid345_4563 [Candidatus Koribacter versatilis Ellin345]|uniref:Adhesin domain-containing protein n=1 Tax=Koribacter versatilis (strain Ellin345) TaxID=204669 RepID=Q1IHT7_KORVE|nr:hypothetical protein [Candidatus Koribacter versatilis]ABF43563.1 hypothetical protein Acid345_4563 [Candidatus Koribacter versatilis Ellin345]
MRNFLVFLLLSAGVAMAQVSAPGTAEQAFASGGSVRLRLEAGEYVIRPSDAEKIVVTVSAETDEYVKQAKIAITLNGPYATVRVSDTPSNHKFKAVIEVPRRTDLEVHMSAGELRVEPVEGSKDVNLRAGEVIIEVPNPEQYGHREAGVWAGSVEASAFDISKGGLFRSFEQSGPGKYRLHAHVMSGEIQLVR